jgi:hypothetical protein
MSRRKHNSAENKFAEMASALLVTREMLARIRNAFSPDFMRIFEASFDDHKCQFCILTREMPSDGG